MVGDTNHVLMHCKKFSKERSVCSDLLAGLYAPVVLTRNLILGLPPPLPSDKTLHRERSYLKHRHEQCLSITGKLIEAIDRRYKL